MCFGGILLEGYNDEFWVALGCLSGNTALKQHALIRGLQLDVSLAVAWAYLGKVITDLCETLKLNTCILKHCSYMGLVTNCSGLL